MSPTQQPQTLHGVPRPLILGAWMKSVMLLAFFTRGEIFLYLINFVVQISSLGLQTKNFTDLEKFTKFFLREICRAKNLRRLWRHFLYFLYIFLMCPRKPTKLPTQKFSPAKFVSYKIFPPPLLKAF